MAAGAEREEREEGDEDGGNQRCDVPSFFLAVAKSPAARPGGYRASAFVRSFVASCGGGPLAAGARGGTGGGSRHFRDGVKF